MASRRYSAWAASEMSTTFRASRSKLITTASALAQGRPETGSSIQWKTRRVRAVQSAKPERTSTCSPATGHPWWMTRYSRTAPPMRRGVSPDAASGPGRVGPNSLPTPSETRPMNISGRIRPKTSSSSARTVPRPIRVMPCDSAKARLARVSSRGDRSMLRGAAKSGTSMARAELAARMRPGQGKGRRSEAVACPARMRKVAAGVPSAWRRTTSRSASVSSRATTPPDAHRQAPARASRRNRMCRSRITRVAPPLRAKASGIPIRRVKPARASIALATQNRTFR